MNEDRKHKFTSEWITSDQLDYGLNDAKYYNSNPHYIFKKQFNVLEDTDAVIYIAAFEMYICKINGKRISMDELNSDWTNYSKKIYYDQYPISQYLQKGVNTIEIEVGNGMANPSPMKLFGKYNLRERLQLVGDPQLLCEIYQNNQKVLGTDKSWKVIQGNIKTNNYYIGEHVDLSSDYSTELICDTSTILSETSLEPSYIEKCKRQNSFIPKFVTEQDEKLIVDFGQTIAGFFSINANIDQKKQIEITYAETKDEDDFNFKSAVVGNGGMKISDFYISGGEGAPDVPYQKDILDLKVGENKYCNKFVYHSFRYAVISRLSKHELIECNAIAVYTDLEKSGTVSTDNKFLNDLFEAGSNTKLNNIHSVFEDCARERLAYGGDMIALSQSNGYLFNVDKMYRKTVNDFRIEQTERGGIPETAPYMGIQTNGTGDGEGPILWQLVYPYLTYRHYQLYGDIKLLENEYYYISKQLNYLLSYDYEYLATRCLGDHGSPEILGEFHAETPDKLFVGYATIALFIETNLKIATAIGMDTLDLEQKLKKTRSIIIEKFQNEDGSFGKKTQTSYAFALQLNLGDRETLKVQLEKKLKADNNIFTAGIFGAAFLYEQLHKLNSDYIVEEWLQQEEDISFKKMLANGDKVLSELFVSKGIKYYFCNHAMFSSYQSWFFTALSGIMIGDDAVGFDKIIISPYFAKTVTELKTSIKTIKGEISVNWNKTPTKTIYQAIIPKQIEALIGDTSNYLVTKETINNNYYQITFESR